MSKQVRGSTKATVAAASSGYQASRETKSRPIHSAKSKERSDVDVTSLFRLTEAVRPKKEPLTIFPNAERLGREAERVVYAMVFGHFLIHQGFEPQTMKQVALREQALDAFGQKHKPKALAVADLLFRQGKVLDRDPQEQIEVLFHAVHMKFPVQLAMPPYETVMYNPGNTREDLRHWGPHFIEVGRESKEIYFEVPTQCRVGSRIIRHPFDIVTVDDTGMQHVIEITNRHRESPATNPVRLIEYSLVELVADRIYAGLWDEQVDLRTPQRRVGLAEVWTIKDRPGTNPYRNDFVMNLGNDVLGKGLELMESTKIRSG